MGEWEGPRRHASSLPAASLGGLLATYARSPSGNGGGTGRLCSSAAATSRWYSSRSRAASAWRASLEQPHSRDHPSLRSRTPAPCRRRSAGVGRCPSHYHRRMTLSTVLIRVSAVIFALIGLGYLVAPSAMLSIVGIGAAPTTDFLMRTEGVALLTGAGLLWAVRRAPAASADSPWRRSPATTWSARLLTWRPSTATSSAPQQCPAR